VTSGGGEVSLAAAAAELGSEGCTVDPASASISIGAAGEMDFGWAGHLGRAEVDEDDIEVSLDEPLTNAEVLHGVMSRSSSAGSAHEPRSGACAPRTCA